MHVLFLGIHFFCMAGREKCALARNWMYALRGLSRVPSFLRKRRGAMFTAKGSGICLGVPWAPRFLRDRNGIMCVAAGFCVAEIIHRGIMCIAKGICLGVVWAPLLLGQRHATMSTAKGSDVRPGVPRAPPLSASLAWVGYTPWCPRAPPLL